MMTEAEYPITTSTRRFAVFDTKDQGLIEPDFGYTFYHANERNRTPVLRNRVYTRNDAPGFWLFDEVSQNAKFIGFMDLDQAIMCLRMTRDTTED